MMSATRVLVDTSRLLVVGQGYVGLPLAIRAAEAGYSVVGYDLDTERIKCLRGGHSYVEDISDSDLTTAIRSGSFYPTGELADCKAFNVAVITVPTPLREGIPDLSFIEQAGRDLAPLISRGCLVILESTTYPGTTEELLAPILAKGSGLTAGPDFHLGYSPERIDPGNDTWSLKNTPKVVSGIDDASLVAVRAFYSDLLTTTIPVSSPKVAEMAKLLENTFRHVNIALVNELAMFARQLGVDIWEAIDAASTKPFGFMKFTPGPGVGGHCLPVDPSYLSWKVKRDVGRPFRFIELANDVNDHMPDYVVDRAAALLNGARIALNGAMILVLGLAYKRNTGDARESPAPVVCNLLAQRGARVIAVDPHLPGGRLTSIDIRRTFDESDLVQADLVIVATDHDAFDWDLVARSARRVLDTRHRVPRGTNVEYL